MRTICEDPCHAESVLAAQLVKCRSGYYIYIRIRSVRLQLRLPAYLHYITLHYITLTLQLHYALTLTVDSVHYITLHYITLHYITITLHYSGHYITLVVSIVDITLHYITSHGTGTSH